MKLNNENLEKINKKAAETEKELEKGKSLIRKYKVNKEWVV